MVSNLDNDASRAEDRRRKESPQAEATKDKTAVGKRILTSDAPPQLKDLLPERPDLLLGLAALLRDGLCFLGTSEGHVPLRP